MSAVQLAKRIAPDQRSCSSRWWLVRETKEHGSSRWKPHVEEFQEETTKPRRNCAISISGCATAPPAAGWGRFCLCVQFTSPTPRAFQKRDQEHSSAGAEHRPRPPSQAEWTRRVQLPCRRKASSRSPAWPEVFSSPTLTWTLTTFL